MTTLRSRLNKAGLLLLILLSCITGTNSFAQEKPHNLIIMIGDGMGIGAVSSTVLSDSTNAFQRFISTGFSITCSLDELITDSGAGGTAIAAGNRTNNGHISMLPDGKSMETILEKARKQGMSVGVVVTSSVTDATPASFLSHVQSRKLQTEIARQISNFDADVIIGGGREFFMPKSRGGERDDEADLIARIKEKNYSYAESYDELTKSPEGRKVFALLEKGNLKLAGERSYGLNDLVSFAIKRLSSKGKGFVLMVEGSQIDKVAHSNEDKKLLGEMKDFSQAIHTALDYSKNTRTLVVVTADHETGGAAITNGEKNGNKLGLSFVTRGHTAALVGVFAKGPGEQLFRGINPNFMIGRKLQQLLEK